MNAKSKQSGQNSQGVQSAQTLLEVLSAFVGAEPTPMLKTLAERTGMHPAKVHRYLVSLCRAGYVQQDAQTSRYRLGPVSLRLAFAAMNVVHSIRVARPLMPEFCARLGHSVVFAIWNAGHPTIVLKETRPGLLTLTASEGAVLPIVRSSIGGVFGAYLAREKTLPLIAAEMAALKEDPQPNLPSSMAALEELFDQIRRRGLARTTGQLSRASHSLAAPVFDAAAEIAGVLCAVGPTGEFDASWNGETALALKDCVATISRGLGYGGASG